MENNGKKLAARLTRELTALGEYGAFKKEEQQRTPSERWLCDHYKAALREGRQIVRTIQQGEKAKEPVDWEELTQLFCRELVEPQAPLTTETLDRILVKHQLCRSLTGEEFDHLPTLVRAALLHGVYETVFGPTPQGEGESFRERRISYCFTSLAIAESLDYNWLLIRRCETERFLRQDPAGVYPQMTRQSRGEYRRLCTKLGKPLGKTGQEIAASVLSQAKQCKDQGGTGLLWEKQCHVGYYLLQNPRLQREHKLRGLLVLWGPPVLALLVSVLAGFGFRSVLAGILFFFPLWELFRPLCSWAACFRTSGLPLPAVRLPASKALEKSARTLAVISSLMPNPRELPALSRRLERMARANNGAYLTFCLLLDFPPHPLPQSPEDTGDLQAVAEMVQQLNHRLGSERFGLLVRRRAYSKTQNQFIGQERKRGALLELARMLKGDAIDPELLLGEQCFRNIRYLLVLDSDTNLLLEGADAFLSRALHLLNRPVIDQTTRRVVNGYGIFTPRLCSDPEKPVSWFSVMLGGSPGISSYENQTAELGQSIFGQSRFTGKGLIELESFYSLLSGRLPEEQVLSHDILEGEILRTAFIPQIELTEGFPATAASWEARTHRWVRGDWQNSVFLCSRIPPRKIINPIPPLGRYWLWENLRLSLLPPLGIAAVLACLVLPPPPSLWLLVAALGSQIAGELWQSLSLLWNGGMGEALTRRFFGPAPFLPAGLSPLAGGFAKLTLLPSMAVTSLDASLRALFRLRLSHKRLLEWQTAAQTAGKNGWVRYLLSSLFGVLLLLLAPAGYGHLRLTGLLFGAALPFVLLSGKRPPKWQPQMRPEDFKKLREYCSSIWQYFEDLSANRHSFLPPDHLEESPVFREAEHTSPTNIGLMLLSALAARDFDFISSKRLSEFLQNSLTVIEGLESWHGNLYNWYDTKTRQVLAPRFVSSVDSGNFLCCLVTVKEGLKDYLPEEPSLAPLLSRIEQLIARTDVAVFYREDRELFSIGWNADSNTLSDSCYDFLMSEARALSYFAIASGQVPKRHWQRLNRSMSRKARFSGPISWTGTMFEYFMPHLFLPADEGTLLGEGLRYAIWCQRHRVPKGVPWGVSESGYGAFDSALGYLYKAHGVELLAQKPGMNRELVISPYSTFLALPWAPKMAMKNLREMEKMGFSGRYGFYESADFTPGRCVPGSKPAAAPSKKLSSKDAAPPFLLVREYMAHHLGMSLAAAVNAAFPGKMHRRFLADPQMGRARELLQERAGDALWAGAVREEPEAAAPAPSKEPPFTETCEQISLRSPRCAVLSNGGLTALYTDSGCSWLAGYGADLTRRCHDPLRRPAGIFVLLGREGEQKLSLTAAPEQSLPFLTPPAQPVTRCCRFESRSVRYELRQNRLKMEMTCTLDPALPCEQRRIRLENFSGKTQLLLYLEPTLSPDRDFTAHPAFSRLFVTSRYDAGANCAVFTRTPREGAQPPALAIGFKEPVSFGLQTRRESLLQAPSGLTGLFFSRPFEEQQAGSVPDGCCALCLPLPQKGTVFAVTLLLAAGKTAADAVNNLVKLRQKGGVSKQTAAASPLFDNSLEGRIAYSLLPGLLFRRMESRRQLALAEANRLDIRSLWSLGISGDLPIAALQLSNGTSQQQERLLQSLKAHRLLRRSGVLYDLAVLYPENSGEQLTSSLADLLLRENMGDLLRQPGGIHLLEATAPIAALIQSVASHLVPEDLIRPHIALQPYIPLKMHSPRPAPMPNGQNVLAVEGGAFLNGAFWVDRSTPLPFSHILANHSFGTLISDSSLGYTWGLNARENKLTPWENDPFTDNLGELLLLRDQTRCYSLTHGARAVFSPEKAQYLGQIGALSYTLTLFVPDKWMAKVMILELENQGDEQLDLACAYYLEPLLGDFPKNAAIPRIWEKNGMIYAENPLSAQVGGVLCLGMEPEQDISAEKSFRVLERADFLSGQWKPSHEPQSVPHATAHRCISKVTPLRLPPKYKGRVKIILSYGKTEQAARTAASQQFAVPSQSMIAAPRFHTPVPALDAFLNGFAPHQILAGRMLGRTGFYQCGGAYGFRDQLQDSLAALWFAPQLTRIHLLRCCAVQFEQGDVLHWWHILPQEKGGLRGARTRCSDDLLWLPYAAGEYVKATGDYAVLDVPIACLTAPLLGANEQERYLAPERSSTKLTVYEHCCLALEKGYTLGSLNLPLMGSGDWNDGFNRVGAGGKGQSVWLAQFYVTSVDRFLPILRHKQDAALEKTLLDRKSQLIQAIEHSGWDDSWYLRAYYDDMTPLGSLQSSGCQLDSITQSFAAFAGLNKKRTEQALTECCSRLVDYDHGIIRLFTPDFSHSSKDPGYGKSYPSGIREHGGQYTHGAIWLIWALLSQNRAEDAWQLLEMANPASRCQIPRYSQNYQLEPYYMAADIYTNPNAYGHGGWSLYTGSAGWFYRMVLEGLLGLGLLNGDVQTVSPPVLPKALADCKLSLTRQSGRLHITLQPPSQTD